MTSFAAGSRLGAYEILAPIGAGGMGEVYRARDLRLGREVAIKVLPRSVSAEPTRLRRFEQEARAASALNHPNIVTIHEIGRFEGCSYIVMELVEGKTLREILAAGPLSTKRLLHLAAQLADGLTKAHSAGIVHRDLKPENLMVTGDGLVKILDFGLCKLEPAKGGTEDETQTQMAAQGTQPGTVLGTAAYMSPEQAGGQPTDFRSDQFSMGTILYEMATGWCPFQQRTAVETMAAIIQRQPEPLTKLNPQVPARLPWVVERCLAKDPEDRYASTRDLAQELQNLRDNLAHLSAGVSQETRPALRRWLPSLTIVLAALVVLLCAASFYWFNRLGNPTDSIAILPLVNASGNPDLEYLGDGITESLINSLSRVPHLAVMSRNSVFRYKGRETDAQAAGQTLKVQAVLAGRVVQRGDSLSISVELIEVRNNRQLWGEQYNRKLVDILAVQEEISTEISEKLRLQLTREEKKRLTKRYTQNAEAYQLYLRGRYHWNKKTPEGFYKGIEYFQKAIEADPNYAPAYAGLAALYNNLANYNFALVAPREAWAKAKAAAGKALQIDGTLAAAHASLALVAYQWEWDWSNAEKEFKRALELDPDSSSTYEPSPSSTHHWYSHYLMTMGRTQESFRVGRRALELDPLDLANNAHQGWHYLWTRQYDRAIEPLQKAIEMDPRFPVPQWYLGLAYEQKGAFQDAIAQFENCVRITGGRPAMAALLGHAHAAANQRSEAQAILQQLSARSKQRYVPSYPVAAIYAALGQKDEAFAWLERAYDERDSWMDYLGLDPRLDGLRSDPRFANLLHRMNLVP